MSYLRRFLEIFLAITVLTLVLPSPNWQDDGAAGNDTTQSPDNSGDQPADQSSSLGDVLLGEMAIIHSSFEYKLLSIPPLEATETSPLASVSHLIPSLPHFFISECGLRPRAPTLA